MNSIVAFSSFEQVEGAVPHTLLDTHPAGELVALQTTGMQGGMTEQAGVWDLATGRLTWLAPNVISLCWLCAGEQILITRRPTQPDSECSGILGLRYSSEVAYVLELMTWPAIEVLATNKLSLPMGWPLHVVASPQDKFVVVTWVDQSESGYVVFETLNTALQQQAALGRSFRSNWLSKPAFSPDGEVLFSCCAIPNWWEDAVVTCDNDESVYHCGQGLSHQVASNRVRPWFIPVTVSQRWLGERPDERLTELNSLGDPEFVGPRSVRLALPTGDEITFGLEFPWER
jgi:hypothetical protein